MRGLHLSFNRWIMSNKLPMKGELTPEQPISPEFEFIGEVSILLVGGTGTVEIQRSVKDSEYYALTDTSGERASYEASGDVILNAEISNSSSSCRYRLIALDSEQPISYIICK